MSIVTIDGSAGEGGGQVLRTSLALAAVTQKPFIIENIRASRQKPGLMRQHLTAVQAATAVSGAKVSGDELGSRRLTFEPDKVRAGEYHFSVGTAGSACLVLQTILPPLLVADGPSVVTIEGGTHNPWAPPFNFLSRAFLPLLARMGAPVTAELERHGFYPAGGGRFRVNVEPAKSWTRLDLMERGAMLEKKACALTALLPDHVAKREVKFLAEHLGWEGSAYSTADVTDSVGPGNLVFVELQSEALTEVFTAFGRKGVPIPQVLEPLVNEVRSYLTAEAPVGPYLADQLLIPLALAGGGRFRTTGLTRHATTNIDEIQQLMSLEIRTARHERGDVLVELVS
jgi:RNA 3'-terminal phosphate cyclase (ATP)